MSLFFRVLQRVPAVQRLEGERDALRSERDSMRLKVRAASAEMGVLEEQGRVLRGERDRLSETVARQGAEQERQASAIEAAVKERDRLAAECRVLLAERDAAVAERDRIARGESKRGNGRIDDVAGLPEARG